MKKISLLTLLVLLSFNSFSAEILISSIKSDADSTDYERARFVVNPQLGRAWVEADFVIDDWHEEELEYEDVRQRVKGLSFDKTSGDIVFTENGVTTVCATSYLRTRIRTVRIINRTGNCTFSERIEYITVDDGYYTKKVKMHSLYLNI
jgi:hypothetical protein